VLPCLAHLASPPVPCGPPHPHIHVPSAHVAGISQLLGFLCFDVMSRMTGMVVTVMASSLVCKSKIMQQGARRQMSRHAHPLVPQL